MNQYNKNIKVNLKPVKRRSKIWGIVARNSFAVIVGVLSVFCIVSAMHLQKVSKIKAVESEIKRKEDYYEELKELFDKSDYIINYNELVLQTEERKYDYSEFFNYLEESIETYKEESNSIEPIANQLTRIIEVDLVKTNDDLLVTVELSFENESSYVEFYSGVKAENWYLSAPNEEEESSRHVKSVFSCQVYPGLDGCTTDDDKIEYLNVEATLKLSLKEGVLNEK